MQRVCGFELGFFLHFSQVLQKNTLPTTPTTLNTWVLHTYTRETHTHIETFNRTIKRNKEQQRKKKKRRNKKQQTCQMMNINQKKRSLVVNAKTHKPTDISILAITTVTHCARDVAMVMDWIMKSTSPT